MRVQPVRKARAGGVPDGGDGVVENETGELRADRHHTERDFAISGHLRWRRIGAGTGLDGRLRPVAGLCGGGHIRGRQDSAVRPAHHDDECHPVATRKLVREGFGSGRIRTRWQRQRSSTCRGVVADQDHQSAADHDKAQSD